VYGFERVQRTHQNRSSGGLFNQIAKKVNEITLESLQTIVKSGPAVFEKFYALGVP
jgi:hypothetical protein